MKKLKELSFLPRSDCLDNEKIAYLNSLTKIKPIWIELGLQSIHNKTLQEMNRATVIRIFWKPWKN